MFVLRLTQSQAATLLGVTARQVRRLVVRYQADGAAGLVSRKRGGVGNHAKDAALRVEVISLIRDHHCEFRPTLIAELLAEHCSRTVSRETVRRRTIAEGLWSDRRASRQRALADVGIAVTVSAS